MGGRVFYKMTGSGNDFVVFDGRDAPASAWTSEYVAELCDRRRGIGADGLVVLTPDGASRVRMDYWNCDGSRADMCGNAALCSTNLSALLEMAPLEGMELVTRAGSFRSRCRADDRARLDLPDVDLPKPVTGLVPEPGEAPAMLTAVGVPHLVLEVQDLERPDLMSRGRELRWHPALAPSGANVNFLAPARKGSGWYMRTYERGVEGETLACGTGAVAAAITLGHAGKATFPVEIVTRSGLPLRIAASLGPGYAREVSLEGEGRLVYRGVV